MSGDYYSHTREIKPCEKCGWKRRVKVTRTRPEPGTAVNPETYWERWCSACEADWRAEKHEESARHFRAKAHEIRVNRAKKIAREG